MIYVLPGGLLQHYRSRGVLLLLNRCTLFSNHSFRGLFPCTPVVLSISFIERSLVWQRRIEIPLLIRFCFSLSDCIRSSFSSCSSFYCFEVLNVAATFWSSWSSTLILFSFRNSPRNLSQEYIHTKAFLYKFKNSSRVFQRIFQILQKIPQEYPSEIIPRIPQETQTFEKRSMAHSKIVSLVFCRSFKMFIHF